MIVCSCAHHALSKKGSILKGENLLSFQSGTLFFFKGGKTVVTVQTFTHIIKTAYVCSYHFCMNKNAFCLLKESVFSLPPS